MWAPAHRGQVQRRLALLVLHGGICSVGQQQSAQLRPALLRRLVERRERPLIGGVDARVVLDQQSSDVNVLNAERQRERSERGEQQDDWSETEGVTELFTPLFLPFPTRQTQPGLFLSAGGNDRSSNFQAHICFTAVTAECLHDAETSKRA